MQTPTTIVFLLGSLLASPIAQAGKCPRVESPAITLADAESIALRHVGGGKVIESKRDCERGLDVYEVEVRDDDGWVHELEISVEDGTIVDEDIDD